MAEVRRVEQETDAEHISLERVVGYIIDECRMVLPGIQAIFGFQLIAVLNEGFQRLTPTQQQLHLAALFLIGIAQALVMTPAAVHRQAERQTVSRRFVHLASRLLLASMFPLALGIALDVYLISLLILGSAWLAAAVSLALLAVFAFLWLGTPLFHRLKLQAGEKS